jgi:hypothetical protein
LRKKGLSSYRALRGHEGVKVLSRIADPLG